MDESLSKYSWLTANSDQQLYQKLLIQIRKDFGLTGLNIDLSDNTEPKELIMRISDVLYPLVQYRFDTFMQLLYRIDIAEQIMKSGEVETAEVLTAKATYQILKREWQKVEWREKFK
jgi:hypothetical protein